MTEIVSNELIDELAIEMKAAVVEQAEVENEYILAKHKAKLGWIKTGLKFLDISERAKSVSGGSAFRLIVEKAGVSPPAASRWKAFGIYCKANNLDELFPPGENLSGNLGLENWPNSIRIMQEWISAPEEVQAKIELRQDLTRYQIEDAKRAYKANKAEAEEDAKRAERLRETIKKASEKAKTEAGPEPKPKPDFEHGKGYRPDPEPEPRRKTGGGVDYNPSPDAMTLGKGLRILGLEPLTSEVLELVYKYQRGKAHPDKGGSQKDFEQVLKAYEQVKYFQQRGRE